MLSSAKSGVSKDTYGLRDTYRSIKAVLNGFMRSFAARHGAGLGLHRNGWPGCTSGRRREHPRRSERAASCAGKPGLKYLDYLGQTAPW